VVGRMKLYITSTGIKDSYTTDYEDAKRELDNARSIRLSSPSSFNYYSYVTGLHDKIKGYSKELTYINNELIKSDNKYHSLFDEERNTINHMNQYKLPERVGVKDVL
jgi:hypothetical protein